LLYHLSNWGSVIEKSYGHCPYYLAALRNEPRAWDKDGNKPIVGNTPSKDSVVGILPLIQIKHWLFGNSFTSIPFFDSAGILAEDEHAEKALLKGAIELFLRSGATTLELRNPNPLISITNLNAKEDGADNERYHSWHNIEISAMTNKVQMLLNLPDKPEELMKSFKSKLRSQIRKPLKEGLKVEIGGLELLDDFYNIFAVNMRDLGSPVHGGNLFKNVLCEFPQTARIFLVKGHGRLMACSLVIGHKKTLSIPWASSLRAFSRFAPNMLLYWAMMEFGCTSGYKSFDFGRCSPGEGTYKFKKQWGARPKPLYWYRFTKKIDRRISAQPEKDKMGRAIEYWKRLPVPVTKILGPRIRKYIAL
jgi:FemAB-related protein (PEP-CTERM system-associated)